MKVRRARREDLPAIREIYNYAVLHTVATADTEPKSIEDRERWFAARADKHPVLVAEENGKILGWGCLNPWSDRPGYAETAENSLYVDPSAWNRGIGGALLGALLEEAKRVPFHTLLARVSGGNPASLRLHEKHGYETAGVLRETCFKFGKRIDVHVLQKML